VGPNFKCQRCLSNPRKHVFTGFRQHVLVHTAKGLDKVPKDPVEIGEQSHGHTYRVAAVITTTPTRDDSFHSVFFCRDAEASSGWTKHDGALPSEDAAPTAKYIEYVLLYYAKPDEDSDEDDADNDANVEQEFGIAGTGRNTGRDFEQLPPFSAAVFNVHALNKRLSEVADICGSTDVTCLSETWQPDRVAKAYLASRPHVIHVREGRAGGAAVILSIGSSIKRKVTGEHQNVEFAACTASIAGHNGDMHVMALYAPPNADCDIVAAAHHAATKLGIDQFDIIAGDVNARHSSWDRPGPEARNSGTHGANSMTRSPALRSTHTAST
jgi:hypothetical protein